MLNAIGMCLNVPPADKPNICVQWIQCVSVYITAEKSINGNDCWNQRYQQQRSTAAKLLGDKTLYVSIQCNSSPAETQTQS